MNALRGRGVLRAREHARRTRSGGSTSSATTAVGASVSGVSAKMTSAGGLDAYETTIGFGPLPALPEKSV